MFVRLLIASLLVLATLVAGATNADPRSPGSGYRMIVNPANGNSSVERRFLADVFLKKTTRWPNGELPPRALANAGIGCRLPR